jgi:integrase
MKFTQKPPESELKDKEILNSTIQTFKGRKEIINLQAFDYQEYLDLITEVTCLVISYVEKDSFSEISNIGKEIKVIGFNVKNLRKINGIFYYRKRAGGIDYQYSLETASIDIALAKIKELSRKNYENKTDRVLEKMKSKKDRLQEAKKTGEKSPMISELYDDYIKELRIQGLSPRTMDMKKQMKGQLEKLKVRTPNQFNQETINRIAEFWQKGYAHNSQVKYKSELKAFLHYLIKKRIMLRADYDTLSFPRGKVRPKELLIEFKDLSNIFTFLWENDRDFYNYISTLFYTISRPAEIVHLQVKDINFAEKQIVIKTNKTAHIGKESKRVPIFTELQEILAVHIEENHLEKTDFLFRGATSTNKSFYGKKFAKLKAKLRLNPEYTLYTYRHTAETLLYMKTKDEKLISAIAGHSIKIALEFYTNYDISALHDGIKGVRLLEK